MMMPMVLLATSTLALTPATRCTGRTSRLSRTSLASSTLAPPEAAEDVLPLDVGERQALSVTERLGRSLTFYSRVLPILARYKLAELDLEQRCADEEECAAEYSELDDWGSDKLRDAILELQGFYVKSGQVLSTRVDLFAKPYCDKLQVLQEGLAPIPTDVVKEVVRRELCGDGTLDELFSDFEEKPLGCASIAQVHAATLLDGRRVAVKVQRPGAKPLLRADVANLKRFAKLLADALPVDYYVVFSELGDVLEGELDFLQEAQAMEKLHAAVRFRPDGRAAPAPLRVPRAVPGLATTKVLVMEFVEGVSLNNLAAEARKRGVEPGSPEAKILGSRIVRALGEAYARMIFGAGFVHGDPHPGNVFVQPGGAVALLDCGQTKQLSAADVERLGAVIARLQAYRAAPCGPRRARRARRRRPRVRRRAAAARRRRALRADEGSGGPRRRRLPRRHRGHALRRQVRRRDPGRLLGRRALGGLAPEAAQVLPPGARAHGPRGRHHPRHRVQARGELLARRRVGAGRARARAGPAAALGAARGAGRRGLRRAAAPGPLARRRPADARAVRRRRAARPAGLGEEADRGADRAAALILSGCVFIYSS